MAIAILILSTSTLALVAAVVFALIGRPRPAADQSVATWRIIVPRDARYTPTQASAWFTSLTSLLMESDNSLTVELVGHRRELVLSLTAPRSWEPTLRAQLGAWFPDARLEPCSGQREPIVSQAFMLKKPEIHPIRLASVGEADPLLGVVGCLTHSPMPCGLRLTISPAPRSWRRWSSSALAAIKSGAPVLPRHWPVLARMAIELGIHALRSPGTPTSASVAVVEAASRKAQSAAYEAQIDVWAVGRAGEIPPVLRDLTAQLTSAFRDPFGNSLISVGKLAPISPERNPNNRRQVLSVEELAALFHLPESEHPLIGTEPTRRIVPAADIIHHPVSHGAEMTWLGEAATRDGWHPFGLTQAERLLHLYVVGKTGTGKSTFLANIARQDLESGRGIALIDPHGDLAERILGLVPPERHGDVLYFNAADFEFPVGFNMLAATSPEQRPLVASGVVGVFKKLYGDSWGPRLEHFLRNAVLTLLETPSPSLLTLPRLLTDRAYRSHVLTYVRDPLLRSFFLEEYEHYDPRWRAEAISPILNKVGQFLASPVVRHIVGQSGPGFDLRQVMDGGGIVIANLASGKIGEDNSDLLGGLLIAGFQLAAMSRANQPEADRRDFHLIVDEFQHFANDAFTRILSEARKYRLSLTLGHQYIDQLPDEIADAVFGNVGSVCAFRVGGMDVGRLERELTPAFDGQDLVHLPNYQACVRLGGRGSSLPAFSARSPSPSPSENPSEPVARVSRDRWARARRDVEAEVTRNWSGPGP